MNNIYGQFDPRAASGCDWKPLEEKYSWENKKSPNYRRPIPSQECVGSLAIRPQDVFDIKVNSAKDRSIQIPREIDNIPQVMFVIKVMALIVGVLVLGPLSGVVLGGAMALILKTD